MISAISAVGNYDSWLVKEISKTSNTQQVQNTQNIEENQNIQSTQQQTQAQKCNSSTDAVKEEAIALAQKVGAYASSSDELNEIFNAIEQALSNLKIQAVNNPQKTAEIAQLEAQYQFLCQSVTESSSASTISSGLTAMANYNIASIQINKK